MSEEAAPTVGPPKNLVSGIVKAVRPRQWVKNILVFAAPLAALGDIPPHDYRTVFTKVAIAFVVFSMAASSIYLINDARDVEADRQHPTKRFRPIAAGCCPYRPPMGFRWCWPPDPWPSRHRSMRTSWWSSRSTSQSSWVTASA